MASVPLRDERHTSREGHTDRDRQKHQEQSRQRQQDQQLTAGSAIRGVVSQDLIHSISEGPTGREPSDHCERQQRNAGKQGDAAPRQMCWPIAVPDGRP